jgi:hypothetical protein
MRSYTVLRAGVVTQRGTFESEELLRQTFPAPEFELRLDVLLPFPARVVDYQEQRRMAYPPLSDFADAMYWQAQGDDSKMAAYMAAVDAVKAQFPKSN